ncbi:homoserine kinase [Planococcus salinarum]|uniref:homoserine kinase n=1 Tax=Planococcus salinarum TaxID=622695 RepID=UPI000E3C82A1|nr:homoserine kinase [Planococcus salinarum]TAA72824.1 homoserine kinase [Planococcus salinarum]
MSWKDFSVRVPASTANLGPGFDSIGLALDLYLTVHIAKAGAWSVEYASESYQSLPKTVDNLLITTIQFVADRYGKKMPTAKLTVETDIPLGRGLGSSASAIAAGIEIADRLMALELPMQEKLVIGTELEGHPDNISASLLGGLTISYWDGKKLAINHIADVGIAVIILVPPVELLTAESRGLLPQELSYAAAIQSSAAANVFSAAVAVGDWATAGEMMENDQFHEPFRRSRFADFSEIRKTCRKNGAYGTSISGAGPSLFIAIEPGQELQLASALKAQYPNYECLVTKPAFTGVRSFERVV